MPVATKEVVGITIMVVETTTMVVVEAIIVVKEAIMLKEAKVRISAMKEEAKEVDMDEAKDQMEVVTNQDPTFNAIIVKNMDIIAMSVGTMSIATTLNPITKKENQLFFCHAKKMET